jgi:hypothetical protein
VSDASLPLTIEWLNNGELIDFEAEPRFVRSSDSSLTITKTTELDSRTYTCVARTELDSASAQATLTVQGTIFFNSDCSFYYDYQKYFSSGNTLYISMLTLKHTEWKQVLRIYQPCIMLL